MHICFVNRTEPDNFARLKIYLKSSEGEIFSYSLRRSRKVKKYNLIDAGTTAFQTWILVLEERRPKSLDDRIDVNPWHHKMPYVLLGIGWLVVLRSR